MGQLLLWTPRYIANSHDRDDLATLQAQLRADRLSVPAAMDHIARLDAMMSHDIAREYGDDMRAAADVIQASMLVVVGTQDHLVTPEPALDFAAMIGAERLALTNDCGHVSFSCEPDRANQAVRRFLEGAE